MNGRNKGLTLVEVQVASAIVLITLSAVLALYLFSWKSFFIGNSFLDVYSNSRNASGWLTRDIRCAEQIVSSHGSYTTTDNSIVLMAPSINSLGEVISPHYDYIIYGLNSASQGKYLYRIVQKDALSSRPNENRVIAHYCDSLTFSSFYKPSNKMEKLSFYDGSTSERKLSTVNTVSIYLPINKPTTAAGTANASISPTTMVRLRNKQ